MMVEQTRRTASLQKAIRDLQQERDATATRLLTIDSFDSSLDRVSEGELKASVGSLNNALT
jgi:hypothetical protein